MFYHDTLLATRGYHRTAERDSVKEVQEVKELSVSRWFISLTYKGLTGGSEHI